MDKDSIINRKEFSMIQNIATCLICCELIKEPVQCTKCENSFCKACIEDWKKKSNECPLKCTQFEMKPSRIVRVLLSQIMFKCPNDCGQEIPHDDYNKHCNETCPKINFSEKYQSLLKSFNSMKMEMEEIKKNSNPIALSYKSPKHIHPLFFNYSNRNNWHCDICSSFYFYNTKGSYFCKDCDFDLCEECKKKEQAFEINN